MLEKLVEIRLFRLERALRLTRPPSSAGTTGGLPGAPAVLVIPRGGSLRTPYLMLVTRGPRRCEPSPGERVFGDTHIVADLGGPAAGDAHEVADVLVGASPAEVAAPPCGPGVLDGHPGCAVVVARCRNGCLAALRDGPLVSITGAAGFQAAAGPWPAVYGSFLYGWWAARMPLESLATATVIAGRYTGRTEERLASSFEVAGRGRIRLVRRVPSGAESGAEGMSA
ncbi:hypothetical protein [Sphaerisporangium sp. NPDC051011]|uniref:hypothetical protein n=1 Tax=Sphaerisporangium sp. NPDC051011 TaxID=3155792 RepID=UPI0033E9653C